LEIDFKTIKQNPQWKTDNIKIKKHKQIANQLPFFTVANPLPIIPLIVSPKLSMKQQKEIGTIAKENGYGIIICTE
jgi:hypothetical protein